MSLPRALAMGLTRFESSKEAIRLMPANKTTFADGEQIVFKLPTSGVIDTYNMSLVCQLTFNSGATAPSGEFSLPYLGQLFRRFEVLAGGQTIWGRGCSDFGLAYGVRRHLAEPDYLASGSNRIFESYKNSIWTANTTYNVTVMMNDMPFAPKNLRFLPLAAFPELEIRITLDAAARINLLNNLTFSTSTITPYLLMSKVSIPGEYAVDNIVARRLQMGTPFEIALEQWTTQQAAPITNSASIPFSVSCQSLDYMVTVFRNSTLTTGNYFACTHMGDGATYQIEVNGVPLSSWQMTSADVYWKLSEALDAGSGNLLVSPQVGASVADWQGSRFYLTERFAFPSVGVDEARSLISGLSTYGSTLPIRVNVSGGNATRTPVGIFIHTSTLELSPGRMISLVN